MFFLKASKTQNPSILFSFFQIPNKPFFFCQMHRTASPSHQALLSDETPTWDQLRKQARTLEGEIEIKLGNLSKIGQSTGFDNSGQEADTDALLKKVTSSIYTATY
jgi:hypothetical protein